MPKCPTCEKELELLCDENQSEYWYVCHPCKFAGRKCEIYSRVVGYLRPTDGWNKGKKEEFRLRKTYKVNERRTTS